MSAGASLQTPWGSLQRSPDFKGAASRQEENIGKDLGRGKGGERGNGKEEKWGSWRE